MRKILSRALTAALVVGAGITYAALPNGQDAQATTQPVSALRAQGLQLEAQARQSLQRMIGTEQGSRSTTSTTAPSDDDDANTAAMLFGALAIMAVMVRRRWNGRD